ncbi:hypothetical protein OAJ14_07760 [Polaribacter sp.]|nr:hypothetical protein [Polaribacter sp.]
MKTLIQITFLLFSFNCISQTLILDEVKCKVRKNEKKAIEEMIELQSDYYKALFKIKVKTIRIKVFGRLKAFKKVRDSISSGRIASETGFYSHSTKTIYVHKYYDYIRVIFHEINHAIIGQIIRRTPPWINEGMAEFFETFSINKNGLSMRLQNSKLERTRKWILEKKINLRDLLNYSHREWHKKNTKPSGYSYSVSYSFICYLHFKHPKSINSILKNLKAGKNSLEAIEIASKKRIEQIENDFYLFMKKSTYNNV